MVKYSKDDEIDIDKYAERIARNSYVLFDRNLLESYKDELICNSGTYNLMFVDVMVQHSCGEFQFPTKAGILRFLQKYERCPEHYFINHKTQSESLDKKKVLEPLLQNGYATEFLTYYTKYRSLFSKSNSLKSLLNTAGQPTEVANDGTKLTKLPYEVHQQTNLRFNYSSCDIIAQIPKEISKCLRVEDGYFLAWGDFAQSDFRIAYNLFLRSEENDALMNKYDDKYEALARMVASKLNTEFDKEKFLEQRKVYKRNTLAVMYGTRNSVIEEDKNFINMFSAFLQKCPRYVEYYRRLKDAHALGLPVALTSYFGHEEVSPILYRETDTVNRALNAPIQTGTSEMIIRTVNSILDRFYELGYTEDDISIYLVRHDEPVFKIKESVMKDLWILKDYEKIIVDDWSPLEMSFELGYSYGITDNDLMNEYYRVVKKNEDKIGYYEPAESSNVTYYPTKKIASWRMMQMTVNDVTILTFYDEDSNLAHSSVVYATKEEEVILAMRQIVTELKLGDEFRGLILENTLFDGEDYANGIYVNYRKASGTQYLKVSTLCRYALCCYCNASGVECPIDPPLKQYEEFIKSVGKLEGFS